MARADFTKSTKESLARRVQYKCAFPGCNAITIGPSDETPEATSNSGMACHIVAASGGPGARRVDPTMSAESRESIDNGIWMCYMHGKLIDTDEVTYTVPMLKRWRELAELRAKLSQQLGQSIDLTTAVTEPLPLAESEVILRTLGDENEKIGQALLNSCISEVWGKDLAAAVRDIAIEVVRNAFSHGAASSFRIAIDTNKVKITDNGNPFLYSSLVNNPNGRGGAAAIKELQSYANNVLLSSRRSETENETMIALIKQPDEVVALTPCAVEFEARNLHEEGFSIPVLSGCDFTYIVMPIFISFSDAFKLIELLQERALSGERFVIVTRQASAGVIRELSAGIPSSQVMVL